MSQEKEKSTSVDEKKFFIAEKSIPGTNCDEEEKTDGAEHSLVPRRPQFGDGETGSQPNSKICFLVRKDDTQPHFFCRQWEGARLSVFEHINEQTNTPLLVPGGTAGRFTGKAAIVARTIEEACWKTVRESILGTHRGECPTPREHVGHEASRSPTRASSGGEKAEGSFRFRELRPRLRGSEVFSPEHPDSTHSDSFADFPDLHDIKKRLFGQETFFGYVESVEDAELLVYGCLSGLLPTTKKRLLFSDRVQIRDGSVFVFGVRESRMERWTDGLRWGPSRVFYPFLYYREDRERYAACKKKRKRGRPRKDAIFESDYEGSVFEGFKDKEPTSKGPVEEKDSERPFLLVKKTISLIVGSDQERYQVVCYQNKDMMCPRELKGAGIGLGAASPEQREMYLTLMRTGTACKRCGYSVSDTQGEYGAAAEDTRPVSLPALQSPAHDTELHTDTVALGKKGGVQSCICGDKSKTPRDFPVLLEARKRSSSKIQKSERPRCPESAEGEEAHSSLCPGVSAVKTGSLSKIQLPALRTTRERMACVPKARLPLRVTQKKERICQNCAEHSPGCSSPNPDGAHVEVSESWKQKLQARHYIGMCDTLRGPREGQGDDGGSTKARYDVLSMLFWAGGKASRRQTQARLRTPAHKKHSISWSQYISMFKSMADEVGLNREELRPVIEGCFLMSWELGNKFRQERCALCGSFMPPREGS
ncbi:MAG: uncharacterized protein A8A55_0403 [Amphiamblys sp. WSBS2006]|nr:MAG: uncharacterized protein A8A55_0403 [Amphiamblys sp. WSBS2006]